MFEVQKLNSRYILVVGDVNKSREVFLAGGVGEQEDTEVNKAFAAVEGISEKAELIDFFMEWSDGGYAFPHFNMVYEEKGIPRRYNYRVVKTHVAHIADEITENVKKGYLYEKSYQISQKHWLILFKKPTDLYLSETLNCND